jgi:hypothetical protein
MVPLGVDFAAAVMGVVVEEVTRNGLGLQDLGQEGPGALVPGVVQDI